MSFLPENTFLGKLELVETYLFYDVPILFTARNISGQLYLAQLEDEDDEVATWFYVPMSKARHEHVRSGAIDLYSAFVLAEDGIVYEIKMDIRDKHVINISILDASEIPQDRLPLKGELLELDTPTAELAINEDYSLRAIQTQREILQLELFFPDQTRTEAPAKPLGEILIHLEDTLAAIASGSQARERISRQELQEIKREAEVVVTGLNAASFNLVLASTYSVNMLGFSRAGDAIDKLFTIIEVGSIETTLKAQLNQFETKVANEYLKLLVAFDNSTIDRAQLTWSSPTPNRGRTHEISSPIIIETINVLRAWEEVSTEIIEITGQLIGLNRRTRYFEIKTRNQTFKGQIDPDIHPDVFDVITHSRISDRYRARLRSITTTKVAISDPETTYRLLELSPTQEFNEPRLFQ